MDLKFFQTKFSEKVLFQNIYSDKITDGYLKKSLIALLTNFKMLMRAMLIKFKKKKGLNKF